jgi:hypothetical protein
VLWVPPGGIATLAQFGGLLGYVDMFERVFELAEYVSGAAFNAGGCIVTATAVPHYQPGRVRASGERGGQNGGLLR